MATREYSYRDLRSAIERREVVPYFQPIVELSSGRLWGFEMLARWHHPERGVVPPADFIPMAEGSWLMAPLFECLCEQAFELASVMPHHLVWSVNITARQLSDRGLPRWLWSIAERSRMPLRQLTVEITETGLIADFDRAQAVANEAKDLGIRIAMDDFGTGYSSLKSLKNIPLDEIKIDQSFVSSMTEQRDSRKIASAVVGLGQSLSLTTVAEGVEKKAHADMLYFMGCTLGQGYFYSRPVPALEIPRLIERAPFPHSSSSVVLEKDTENLEFLPSFRLAQYTAMLDGLNVGIGFVDRDFRYRNLNKWWIRNLSLTPRLGRTIREASPNNYRQIEPYLKKGLEGESTYNVELEDIDDPSHPRRLSISLFPVYDEAQEILGLCICVGDITEGHQREQGLSSTIAKYRGLLSQHGMTFFTADSQGRISWSAMTLFDTQQEQVLGDAWQALLHPEDRDRVLQTWSECVTTGLPFLSHFRLRAPEGAWHNTVAQAIPKFSGDGQILEWSGFLQDLTALPDQLRQPKSPETLPHQPVEPSPPATAPARTAG